MKTKAPPQTIDATTGEIILVTPDNVEKSAAVALKDNFQDYFKEAEALRLRATDLAFDESDPLPGMKEARALRLELRAVRVAAEKTRKSMKEESLRTGKAIDGLYNLLAYAIIPLEESLAEREAFAIRQREQKRAELRAGRDKLLASLPYPGEGTIDLADLDAPVFDQLLQDAKELADMRKKREEEAELARIAEEKRLQEEREAKRLAEEAERKRVLEESKAREAALAAKLAEEQKQRAEIEAQQKAAAAKAAKERAELEAKAKADADARELERKKEAVERAKIEAEAKALRDAAAAKAAKERAEELERAAAEKRAATAPDREKLSAFVADVRALRVPSVSTKKASAVADEITAKVEAFAEWIDSQIDTLNK
jgi:hypothetical protein